MSEAQTKIEDAMTYYWGERCAEHEPGCPKCDAWAEYDERIRPESINSAALDELGKMDGEDIRIAQLEAELAAEREKVAGLVEALQSLIRDWEQNDAADEDEWSDGYEDALADVARKARAALAKYKEGE